MRFFFVAIKFYFLISFYCSDFLSMILGTFFLFLCLSVQRGAAVEYSITQALLANEPIVSLPNVGDVARVDEAVHVNAVSGLHVGGTGTLLVEHAVSVSTALGIAGSSEFQRLTVTRSAGAPLSESLIGVANNYAEILFRYLLVHNVNGGNAGFFFSAGTFATTM